MTDSDYTTRIRLLRTEVRDLRRQIDLYGTADTVHQLRNHVGAAETALRIVEGRLGPRDPQLELLLELAQTSLRRGWSVIARIHEARFWKYWSTAHITPSDE